MGYGDYSIEAHRVITRQRERKDYSEVFGRRSLDPAMDPKGVRWRESRDSPDHPASLAIAFALDVSGSMEDVPITLAKETLPTFMELVGTVVDSPQVLFMAFGNAYTDESPLQVGQFESTAELMDRWLSGVHLEMGGGGVGESYGLAMYFAARHTKLDCLEARGRKGYFFMTGDEPPFVWTGPDHVGAVLGQELAEEIRIEDMLEELQRSWEVFFLIPDPERARHPQVGPVWQVLLHEHCIILDSAADTALVAALCVGIRERVLTEPGAVRVKLAELGVAAGDHDRLLDKVRPLLDMVLESRQLAPPERLEEKSDDGSIQG